MAAGELIIYLYIAFPDFVVLPPPVIFCGLNISSVVSEKNSLYIPGGGNKVGAL